MRHNPDEKLRRAERRFQSEPTDENYREFAKLALRAGVPLVRFSLTTGGSIHPPHDPGTNSCVWVTISVSGRALPGAGVMCDEWVTGHIAQLPASQAFVAQMLVDAMNGYPHAQFERWSERPEVNSQLRISGTDYNRRVQRGAEEGAVYSDVFLEAGFTIWHTGGGCTAWGINAPDGERHSMITGGGGAVPEGDDEEILVGIYDEDEFTEGLYETFPATREGAVAAVGHVLRVLEIPVP